MKIFRKLHNIGAWIAFYPSHALLIIFITCFIVYMITTEWSR